MFGGYNPGDKHMFRQRHQPTEHYATTVFERRFNLTA